MSKTNLSSKLLLILLLAASHVSATQYYVSTTGNDDNGGAEKTPLRTIKKASEVMLAGDTCFIRGGTYRTETVLKDLNGKPEAPLTFQAYPSERVVLDGTKKLDLDWQKWKGNIYCANLERDVWQLFIGTNLVGVARWPNANLQDGSIWDVAKAMRFTDHGYKYGKNAKTLGKSTNGIIYDRSLANTPTPDYLLGNKEEMLHSLGENTQTLAQTEIDFTGAVAVLNIRHWLTWGRPVTEHEAGREYFEYDSSGTKIKKLLRYYLLGLQCIDTENEWWYDNESDKIYLYAPGGANPNNLSISARVRDFSLTAKNCSHLSFRDLNFFGSTFRFENCSEMLIEDSKLLYPSTHKFMLGHFGWARAPSHSASENSMTYIHNNGKGPFNNTVRNCTFAYPNSPAINVVSPGSTIENCYMHDIEWDLNSSGGSGTLPAGPGTTIRNNTIHTAGNSEGIRPGPHSIVAFNHVYNTGLLQHDGSAINIGQPSQQGALVHHNWVHGADYQGIRFDSTRSAFGTEGCIYANVMFDIQDGRGGSKIKGDYHLVLNNTSFDSWLAIPKGFGDTEIQNCNTLVRNNINDYLVEWNLRNEKRRTGIVARCDHNLTGEGVVRANLRDPDNLDFRPKPGSSIIDAGAQIGPEEIKTENVPSISLFQIGAKPDIGAYEFGAKDYWIPGCRQEKASLPIPPDGTTSAKRSADLIWQPAYKSEGQVVYFSSDKEAVTTAKRSTWLGKLFSFLAGEPVCRGKFNHNICDLEELESGKTYFWRVDSLKNGKLLKGDVWEFRVE